MVTDDSQKVTLREKQTAWADPHLVKTFLSWSHRGLQTESHIQDTSLLLLRGIMKLRLSFKRLEVNNNNINPRNLLSKAGPERRGVTELCCYWPIPNMCRAWQTHLGRSKNPLQKVQTETCKSSNFLAALCKVSGN